MFEMYKFWLNFAIPLQSPGGVSFGFAGAGACVSVASP